jgi:hypothetical protein
MPYGVGAGAGFIKRTPRASATNTSRPLRARGFSTSASSIRADLNEHIDRLCNEGREQLICDAPRSYLGGENNICHAATTRGIEVIVDGHYRAGRAISTRSMIIRDFHSSPPR